MESGLFEKWRIRIGIISGPLALILILIIPITSLNYQAHRLFAILVFAVIYWLTEALPLGVTSLLIPAFCLILGVCDEKSAFINFAHPIIFLFIGSFILAKSMEKYELDKYISLKILSVRGVRNSAFRFTFVLGFTIFILSWWLSNTATTAMMFPIVLSITKRIEKVSGKEMKKFNLGVMLLVAYSASIGGIATPVGTPPNLIGIGMLDTMANIKIGFFQWMIWFVPISIIIFLMMFFYLYFTSLKEIEKYWDERILLDEQAKFLKLTPIQKKIIISFSVTIFLWILPGIIMIITGSNSLQYKWLSEHFSEAVAAIIGVSLLFILSFDLKKNQSLIKWKEIIGINWEAIFLFGGGLTLGALMFQTKLSNFIAEEILKLIQNPTITKFILMFSLLTGSITELTSNTATANMIIPLAISLSIAAKINPLMPALAAAIGSSLAFMFPVATPPNAIVYGSGYISFADMAKKGFFVLVSSAIILSICLLLISL